MTYLDAPRFHFAGNFLADPSTVNNSIANYNNDGFNRDIAWERGPVGSWNPIGPNTLKFDEVRVRSATLADGNAAATTDSIFTSTLATKPPGRLVDLDPD